jgi:hypothetical protein
MSLCFDVISPEALSDSDYQFSQLFDVLLFNLLEDDFEAFTI